MRGGGERREGKEGRGGKARRGEERSNILSGLASLRMEHWHWEAAQEKKKGEEATGMSV